MIGSRRATLLKLALVCISTAVSIAMGELVLRQLLPESDAERMLFYSEPPAVLDDRGAVRYTANATIRTAAVYGDAVAYDVDFRTNNAGFVDTADYPYESERFREVYAFVGDSYTAGYHGGQPWLSKLGEMTSERGIGIYNLGVGATGVQRFASLLTSVGREIPFDHIRIVVISDNFTRPYWRPLIRNGELRLCLDSQTDEECSQARPIGAILGSTWSTREMIDRVSLRSQASEEWRLMRVIRMVRSKIFPRNRETAEGFVALESIRAAFPDVDIQLIHIPFKTEVANGEYEMDIADEVIESGIGYFPAFTECSWEIDMFFELDPHLNAKGNTNLTECVYSHLLDYDDVHAAALESR